MFRGRLLTMRLSLVFTLNYLSHFFGETRAFFEHFKAACSEVINSKLSIFSSNLSLFSQQKTLAKKLITAGPHAIHMKDR